MSAATNYHACKAEFPDSATQLDALLECISTAHSAESTDIATGLDAFFLISAGALVFFMQTGFAMLLAGSIRSKNVKNVLLWNLLDSAGGGLAFWSVGYAFAYGGDGDAGGKTFVGNKGFFMQGDEIRFEYWFFQFAFACAVSSILAGSVAERMQMRAYLLYSVFLVGFVYPVVAHAFWSTHGFLSVFAEDPLWGAGVVDFAGSGPVHMLGGVGALVGAVILGPRIGRFHDRDGNLLEQPAGFPPHSVALQLLGTFCLWFGWYGFNPGSASNIASADRGEVAALAAVNTTLVTFISATTRTTMTMNGCLTGLVGITAGCASVDTWSAVLIGMVAGWVYMLLSKWMVRLRIDDAVDAIPVHLGGGMWGVLAAGLFSEKELLQRAYGVDGQHVGWFFEWGMGSGDFTLIGTQLVGVLFIFGWTAVMMGSFFYFLNFMGWFRIDPLEEEVGVDISRHKGVAYDIQAVNDDSVQRLKNILHARKMKEEEEASPVETTVKEPPNAPTDENEA